MFFIQSGKCDVIIEVTTPLPPPIKQSNSNVGRLSMALKGGGKRLKKAGTFNFNFKTRMTHHGESDRQDDSDDDQPTPSTRQSKGVMNMDHEGSQRFSNRVSINGTMYKVMEKSVKELDTGSYFGEIALIIDSRRTASIRSRTFTELLVLTRDDFLRITENNHEDREEMKNQIKARYQTDKNVKKALENQGKESVQEREEKEKQLAMKSVETTKVGRRQSFLEIHASAHNHNTHKGSVVDSEVHELKIQLRNMAALMSRTAANVDEMAGRERDRKIKMRRRKKKLQAARNKERERERAGRGGGGAEKTGSSMTVSTVDSKSSKDSPTSTAADDDDDEEDSADLSSEEDSEVGSSTEEEEGDLFDVSGPLPGMIPSTKSSGSGRALLREGE